MDPFSQHFSLNAQEACVNYFQFWKKYRVVLLLAMTRIEKIVDAGREVLGIGVPTL